MNIKQKIDNSNNINICNSNEFFEAGDFPLDIYNEEDQKYYNFPLQ